MNEDIILNELLAVSMEQYDAQVRNEPDPVGRALWERARPQVEAMARERIARSLFKVIAEHEAPPDRAELN
jgi:hypothetical protein